MTETPEVQPPGANVPGYLLPLSILATLFCCLPAGIVAIVFSVQARSRSQAGDYPGASQAMRKANIWLITSVVLGIILIVLISSLGILGSLTGSSENKDNYSRPNSKNEQPVSRDKNEQQPIDRDETKQT